MNLTKFKPAVPIKWLIGLAGGLWSIVGLMLCVQAVYWLKTFPWVASVSIFFIGMLLAYAAYRFAFNKIANANINRILSLSAESCIFAFQAWRSYFIIVVMIILGMTLRQSLIPRYYLSLIYLTIGGALFLSSLRYYACLK